MYSIENGHHTENANSLNAHSVAISRGINAKLPLFAIATFEYVLNGQNVFCTNTQKKRKTVQFHSIGTV